VTRIASLAELEALYGAPGPASLRKVADRITPDYRALIEAAPFCALATSGPEGLDVSPRGDRAGSLVRIADERRLMLPDRRGNDRIDSLRNVVRDPRLALMFLIPGWDNALRVNGRGHVEAGAELLASFAVDGKAPRSVLVIDIEEIYFQCARAMVRSGLWSGAAAPAGLPTAGRILSGMTAGEVGGPAYDSEWPGRAAKTMW
jgi:PPOX class probable FMN-dependent enzyme